MSIATLTSLSSQSAGRRLLFAGALIALLWLGVAWALSAA